MADANVRALIQAVNRLVVEDTGPRSPATGDQIVGRVTRSDQERLGPARMALVAAEAMAEVYGDEPGTARREAAGADRARADNPLRFAPGHDPATTTPRTTTAPANAPTATQSAASLQSEPRDRDR
ncbi:hypothetical protein ACXC9Q_28765 [Kribbella sp. CWNU-51]